MLENDVKKEKYSNVLLHEPGSLISNSNQSVKKKTYISSVFFYFFIIFVIYFSFFINFLMTKNSFSKNRYITIKPEILCNKYSINFNKCLDENKDNKEKCNNEGKELEGCYDILLLGVFHHRLAGLIAVCLAGTRKEQTQIVVHLRRRAYRRTRVLVRRFLFNADDGRQSRNLIHVGPFHASEEVARIGRECLNIAALTFGKDGVESQTRLSASAQSCDDCQRVAEGYVPFLMNYYNYESCYDNFHGDYIELLIDDKNTGHLAHADKPKSIFNHESDWTPVEHHPNLYEKGMNDAFNIILEILTSHDKFKISNAINVIKNFKNETEA